MSRFARRFLGLRLDAIAYGRYVGICTQHVAILTRGKGTYCVWHRWRAHFPRPPEGESE